MKYRIQIFFLSHGPLCRNCQTEQAAQYPPSKRVEEADDARLLQGSCNDWYLSVENGETIPIMEAPYADSDSSGASTTERDFFLGFVSKEQEQLCIAIEEWKLDLTAEGGLAIYVKTTKKVW